MYEIYKQLRDARGVTDYAVAKACGIKQTTFTEWAKVADGAGSTPKIEKLQKIASFFSVSLDYLVNGENYTGEEQMSPLLQAASENKNVMALLDAAKDLRSEDLQLLIGTAKRLRGSYHE